VANARIPIVWAAVPLRRSLTRVPLSSSDPDDQPIAQRFESNSFEFLGIWRSWCRERDFAP
jgi:hypothetical protein